MKTENKKAIIARCENHDGRKYNVLVEDTISEKKAINTIKNNRSGLVSLKNINSILIFDNAEINHEKNILLGKKINTTSDTQDKLTHSDIYEIYFSISL